MSGVNDRRKHYWDDNEEDSSSQGVSHSTQTEHLVNVDQKIHECEVLLDQTHQLYQHFFVGVEKRPPREKAQLLESKIAELQHSASVITSARFKVNQVVQRHHTFRNLWEKKLKDRERQTA
jgi:hypothetical protein